MSFSGFKPKEVRKQTRGEDKLALASSRARAGTALPISYVYQHALAQSTYLVLNDCTQPHIMITAAIN